MPVRFTGSLSDIQHSPFSLGVSQRSVAACQRNIRLRLRVTTDLVDQWAATSFRQDEQCKERTFSSSLLSIFRDGTHLLKCDWGANALAIVLKLFISIYAEGKFRVYEQVFQGLSQQLNIRADYGFMLRHLYDTIDFNGRARHRASGRVYLWLASVVATLFQVCTFSSRCRPSATCFFIRKTS